MSDHFETTELQRKLANVVMVGKIFEVYPLTARASVQIGGLLTAPLPWLSPRMGHRRDWAAPKYGEQVLVLCHNGDPAQGYIIASLGSDAQPNPSFNPRIFKTIYSDGTSVQVDLDTHEISIAGAGSVTASIVMNLTVAVCGAVQLDAGSAVTITAPEIELVGAVKVTGSLTVTGKTALQTTTVKGVTLESPNDLF